MADEGGVKPEAGASGGGGGEDFLTIKVQTQDGGVIQFKTKKSTQIKKLMKAYAERQGVDVGSVAFTFDGNRLNGTETPEELGMEDMDTLDVFLHQVGGRGGL